jgi:hypothetical protein
MEKNIFITHELQKKVRINISSKNNMISTIILKSFAYGHKKSSRLTFNSLFKHKTIQKSEEKKVYRPTRERTISLFENPSIFKSTQISVGSKTQKESMSRSPVKSYLLSEGVCSNIKVVDLNSLQLPDIRKTHDEDKPIYLYLEKLIKKRKNVARFKNETLHSVMTNSDLLVEG